MAAVILGWNPTGVNRWDYRAAVEQVTESGRVLARWNVGGSRNILPGTEVWLLLQGSSDAGRGLIGHGMAVSAPAEPAGREECNAGDGYASIAFDALLPIGEQIRPDLLKTGISGPIWWEAIAGPVPVPQAAEPELRRLWREQGPVAASHAELVPGTFPPEAVATIDVNRYERDVDASRVCLAFHGTSCAACGFSFEAFYGDAGTGFIEVHHVVPPAMLKGGYKLDPVADLVPLCPNCHAMAHLGVAPPRTVSELRTIIAAAGHLRGQVVSEHTLEAQADARRILEGPHDIQGSG